ncbi:MAG: cofactor assembly of complex C subunit B [Spirulina sp. SIO3F2]|nr:cofactor assembly of complex C subunit B [Spirulina sp. SIO3F2]
MTELPVLSSTFFLTLLMFVGLWFFIRASVKERIEQMELTSDRTPEQIYQAVVQYFERRAYQVSALEPGQNAATLEGFVRPSLFLAFFLSFLAACGLFCLGLVLAYLLPALGGWTLLVMAIAPGAGVFYWRKAGRVEQVQIKVMPQAEQANQLWVQGHRDELAQLRQNFGAILSVGP